MPVMNRRLDSRRAVRRGLAVWSTAALLLVLIGWSSPAHAHTEIVASTPAPGDTVGIGTDRLVLVFSAPLATGTGQVVVLDGETGDTVDGAPVVSGSTLEVPLALRSRGTHDVTYRVVSADGHPLIGEFEFTVRSGRSGGLPAGALPAGGLPSAAGPQVPGALWFGGIGLVVLSLVAVQALRRSRPSGPVDVGSR